jgi:signal-transduction protein with cAMP-binding, CBS, and nucleotidyltransferase domain
VDPLIAVENFRSQINNFVTLTDEEWDLFKQHINYRQLKKKALLAEEGKVCDEIGFIAQGSVRYFHMRDGVDITGYFSFDNEFVSSYKSYLKQEPSLNYIQTLEDSLILTIKHKSWHEMLNDVRLAYKIERFGRLIAEYYLCCYEDRVTAFITQTPEERYLKLMETGREILLRIPQRYVANFLGITPVSLSRIRKRVLTIHR